MSQTLMKRANQMADESHNFKTKQQKSQQQKLPFLFSSKQLLLFNQPNLPNSFANNLFKPLFNQKYIAFQTKQNIRQISMINNYVQYDYQPCHLIHSFDDDKKFNMFLGDVSSALDLEFIQKSNIKTVVTAAAGMDQVVYHPEDDIKHIVYSVLDHKNENLIKFFDEFFELVQKQIKLGSILVHCAAGISRSSTLVISYLMKKFNWSFKEAIKYVRKSRPTVLPNLGFERQLKQYQKIIVQQQNRRLKSKTSESNKHAVSQNNKSQLFPEIGILGVNSTKNKILQAYKIYKRDEEQEKIHKKNIFINHQSLKNDQKVNSLKYQQFQKFKPLTRQFGQTKSVSLQQGIQRNIRQYEEGGKLSSYLQVKTDHSDFVSSRKQLVSRNGLFDSAIIPIKYNTVNKPGQKLKKTNIKFSQINTNSININRINIFKQKYSRNNQPLSLGKPEQFDQNENHLLKNDIEVNLGELKTRQHFTIKLSKVKESPNDLNTNLMSGKNQGGYFKKEGWVNRRDSQMKNRNQIPSLEQGIKKVTIKNLLFSQS